MNEIQLSLLAIQGNFAYSFLLGVLAAVNPCGFVLLPAYLLYFLGLDKSNGQDTQRASLRRALIVSSAVSFGFIVVFLVVGTISRLFTHCQRRLNCLSSRRRYYFSRCAKCRSTCLRSITKTRRANQTCDGDNSWRLISDCHRRNR